MLVAGLLQEPQAEHLDDPSDEDQSHQWGDGRDVLSRQRHLVEGVESRSLLGQQGACGKDDPRKRADKARRSLV